MPILGREGESFSQRLFGNPGVGQGLKNIDQGGWKYLIGRTAQAMETPGGFLGDKTQASTPTNNYSSPNQNTPINLFPIAGNRQTSGTGNKGTSSSKTSSNDDRKALDKLRKSISSQFDDVIGTYSNQIKSLPGEQNQLIGNVNSMAQTQKGSISSALDAAMAKLSGNRVEVQDQQKQTLQGLADNTRNLFQAGNNYLGTRGAGDSSATGMYSAALTQNANKERAGVQRDVNSTMNEIGMKETDVNTAFQQQLTEVDTWAQTQTQNIVMEYTNLKRQLEQAKANASSQEKANLSNLEANLYEAARNQLANLQQTASQARTSMNQGIQAGSGLGAAGASNIATTGQYQVGQPYQPSDIDISGLQDIGGGNFYDQITGNYWQANEDGTLTFLQSGYQTTR